jgi:hypothetical protein
MMHPMPDPPTKPLQIAIISQVFLVIDYPLDDKFSETEI